MFDFGRGLKVLFPLCAFVETLLRCYVATCYADIRLLRSAFCVLRAAPYALTRFLGMHSRRDNFSIERITYVRTRCGICAYAGEGGV